MKDKLEEFLSVTLKPSNTPRLLTLYVSFIVTCSHVIAKKTIRVQIGGGFNVFAVLSDVTCLRVSKPFCVTNDTAKYL